MAILQSIGGSALDYVRYGRDLIAFFHHAIVVFILSRESKRRVLTRTIINQIYFTGVHGVGVVSMLGLILGTGLIVVMLSLFSSAGPIVGTLMDMLIIQQLGPLMTAFIVIGRSGSAITVELGNLRVNGELDLLETMGIDPIEYLVVPRMVGVTVGVVCLCVFFDLCAMGGGFAVASLAVDIPIHVFFDVIGERVTLTGIFSGLFKSAAFGMTIATLSSYHGLSGSGISTEVPILTQQSVVRSLVLCVFLDLILTIIFL